MVSGILQIADSLGLDVVAEGIERTSERDLLSTMGWSRFRTSAGPGARRPRPR
jgi:EAL domain-containing protein (putative c-di-GMP-specific phosphodiesterase class I)